VGDETLPGEGGGDIELGLSEMARLVGRHEHHARKLATRDQRNAHPRARRAEDPFGRRAADDHLTHDLGGGSGCERGQEWCSLLGCQPVARSIEVDVAGDG